VSQGRAASEPPPPAPAHRGILVGFALATLGLHLAVLTRYGWFRDELYYVVCARRLAWGYVDHPPLSIALLALVRLLYGESLAALRMVPALAGVATVALTGLLAARLGGGRFAQALACCTALLAPVLLGITRFYSMNAFDLLFWTLAALVMVGIVRQGSPRQWVGLGVVLGLGLLNKISVLWLGAGLAAALALTRERRWLLTPWPYVAALVAAALFLPHLLWQVAHGWPTLEFMRNATGRKMIEVSVVDFWTRQLMSAGPANALVWLPGLGFALFARAARAWRLLAIVYLTAAGILMLGGSSRASYLAVAYPMLLALGGVAWESFTAGRVGLRPALLAIVVLLGLVPIPFALPVLPVEGFIRYQAALGMTPETEERHAMGPLPSTTPTCSGGRSWWRR
jgi:4-amino-4-deoxy-L-arabinose transferase-like glycosyltransferase